MTLQLVLVRGENLWYAFYCPADKAPMPLVKGTSFVKGKTIKEAIKKAKAIKPKDAKVMFTYLAQ